MDVIDLETYREQARSWIQTNLSPITPAEKDRRFFADRSEASIAASRAEQRRLFDAGYAGIDLPTDYGGQGLTPEHDQVFRQESHDFALPDFGGFGIAMFGPIAHSMVAHGTPDFLRRHLPPLLRGEALWCQFYSEPDAGSDLAGVRTRATRDGDHWVLNGAKAWTTGAQHADRAMCLARTNWDVPKHRGLTWFAVDMRSPGVTIVPIRQIGGGRRFCQEYLDDVHVPAHDVIGDVDDGWSVTHTMLLYERSVGEHRAPPIEPQALAPDLVALARATGQDSDLPTRQAIAQTHIDDYAQYALTMRTSALVRSGSGAGPAIAAYGKLAGGMYAPERARVAVEIGGAAAMTWERGDDVPVETTNYLNGRMLAIAAGTNEMQRNAIGEQVLGLPREPTFDSRKSFNDVLRDAQNWDSRVG